MARGFSAERHEARLREANERWMREWLAELETDPGPGYCYFVEDSETGRIKIGASTQPARRLKELQRDTPYKLKMLAKVPGGRDREAYYHLAFKAHHRGGEWFDRAPEILAEVARLGGPSFSENQGAQDVAEIAVGGKLWRAG